jgi:DNA-directed RNA polymerase subunit beta'
MRTFHTGGVAGGDITQGLPRVEELFEARKPKGMAIVTEYSGKVKLTEDGNKREIQILGPDKLSLNAKPYLIPFGSLLKVKDGDMVNAGDPLTEGSIDPHDILNIQGVRKVQDYLLKEVQKVYRLQGVEINDKHIEMIVRQMLRKMLILDAGDSKFLPDTAVDIVEFEEENERLRAEGKKEAKGKEELKGITKASLTTESFLSAASFQETTRVLTEASINGKIDKLEGLKENVIIGRTIPTGTGMKKYQNTTISTEMEDNYDNEEDSFEVNPENITYEAKEYKVQTNEEEE